MTEEKTGTKDVLPQETARVIKYFSENSGFRTDETEKLLGDVVKDFDKPPELVVNKYFNDESIKRALMTGVKRYEEHVDDVDKRNALFWRDVLVNLLHQPSFREKYNDKWFDVVALNGLQSTKDSLLTWSGNEALSVSESMKKFSPNGYTMLEESLKEGETVESRLSKAQAGLNESLIIGREIVLRGKIPITRMVFFENQQAKEDYIKKASAEHEFSNRNQGNLEGYGLNEVHEHTQAPAEQTPLSSWTYVSSAEPWRYGLGSLGRSNAVMLVSEVDLSETVWSRNLTEGSTWKYKEEVKWYDKPDVYSKPMEGQDKVKLNDLHSRGVKAALMPTEGEVVVWGKTPVRAIIDLGP